jgi:hypothetical protein
MTIQKRELFAPSADNGLPPASAVDGGDNSLDRGPGYVAPLSVKLGDQESPQTASERAGLVSSFNQAKDVVSHFEGSGATGVALSREAR